MRHIITIIIISFVLIGVGFGVYFFFVHRARVVVAPPAPPKEVTFPVGTKVPPTSTKTPASTTPIIIQPISSTPGSPGTPQRLVKITSGPVAPGIVVFDISTSTATSTKNSGAAVSYIDRKSGNGYSYNVLNGTLSRLSNKTIPGVRQAAWLYDGSLAYLHYYSTTNNIETYALPANGIGGFFLAQGLSSIVVNRLNSILTLSSDKNGSIVTQSKTNDSSPYTAFQTPLSSIVVSFAGPDNYLVYTKPSATIAGYAFLVNKKTKAWERVAGPLDGLAAKISPNGATLLISYTDTNGDMQMALVTIATHTLIPLPVTTIATKCVWTADSSAVYCGIPTNPPAVTYPDNWYQGTVTFNDRIWKINVGSRYAQLVLDFSKETKKTLDATSLAVDPDATTLSFINKNNGSLWEYQL